MYCIGMCFNCLMTHLDEKSAMGSGNGLVLSVEVNSVFVFQCLGLNGLICKKFLVDDYGMNNHPFTCQMHVQCGDVTESKYLVRVNR